METYCKRTWLNKETSASTGSVVTFDGRLIDHEGNDYQYTYIEFADCNGKVTLHITSDDTVMDFIDKLNLLKNDIELFIKHLETKEII